MSDQKVWRYPGDSREDRAKRVASEYRDLALRLAHQDVPNPGHEVYKLDRQMIAAGMNWVVPKQMPLDLDEWLPACELAPLVDRTPRDIYDMGRRGRIESRPRADGSPEYNVGSVIEWLKKLRLKRMGGGVTELQHAETSTTVEDFAAPAYDVS